MSSNDQDVTGESGSGAPSQQPTAPQNTAPQNSATQIWGAEQPAAGPRWSTKKTIAAVAVAVGIAAAGGGVIHAASGSTGSAAGGFGGMGGGFPGGVGGAGFGDALHGEFQTGEVTEVSDSSISVESTDGYSRTYVIDDDTVIGSATGTGGGQQRGRAATGDVSSIETGDTVVVVASTADGTTTADSVSERGDTRITPGGQDGQQPGVQPRRQDGTDQDGTDQDGTDQDGEQQQPTTG